MKLVNKGSIACVIDYPRTGEISETVVISSGNKYIKVQDFPYLRFDANTLYNLDCGGGMLYIGTKQQYICARKHAKEKAVVLNRVKNMLHELSMIQLRDIEYQLKQMLS